MLTDLYPRYPGVRHRYASLPVLGPILDGYADWLSQRGYPPDPIRQHVRAARRLDLALRQRGARRARDLTRDQLRACAPAQSQDDPEIAVLVRCLQQYLEAQGRLVPPPLTRLERQVDAYGAYLVDVRGLASSTVAQHRATAAQFLAHLGYEADPAGLARLAPPAIDAFVQRAGGRIGRASLQHVVAQLRGFLRFLITRGEAPPGLETQIDTPRVYRGEHLPRALPWETVRAFLRAIDRSTPLGRRDYAMVVLIATYGLRASEIVALTLDDLEWRAGRIRVASRKTGTALVLPLTDEAATSLVDYLRRGRPPLPYREVFLRGRAPAGVLKPTAVAEAFQAWARRSGLPIAFHGPHCLRHAYALRLLREGTSLKTIGDVLGHRHAESTAVYLRLAVDDLREVALSLPRGLTPSLPQEARS
jgi:site-specific recombinase XerD